MSPNGSAPSPLEARISPNAGSALTSLASVWALRATQAATIARASSTWALLVASAASAQASASTRCRVSSTGRSASPQTSSQCSWWARRNAVTTTIELNRPS